jgi:hypothetical protein
MVAGMTRHSARRWVLGAASIVAVGAFGSGYAVASSGPGDRGTTQVIAVPRAQITVPALGDGVFYPPLIVPARPTPVRPGRSRGDAPRPLPRSGDGVYYPPLIVPVKPTPATARARSASGGLSCRSVIWLSLRNGQQNCPASHSVLSDVSFINLRWTQWNTREAVGTGISAHYTSGKIDIRTPITIRLTRVRICPGQPSARVYRHIEVTDTVNHVRQQGGWSYNCVGRGSAGGG